MQSLAFVENVDQFAWLVTVLFANVFDLLDNFAGKFDFCHIQ